MTVNERLITALSPLGFPVAADVYAGEENTYITFHYNTHGALFTNNAPMYDVYHVMVHFFCPYSFEYAETVKFMKQALFSAEFTWPEMKNVTGEDGEGAREGRHLVFTCEIEEGTDNG